MRKIVWLESAITDVARLRQFITKKNAEAAKMAAKAIKIAAKNLIETPEIGKPVQQLLQYRDLLIRFGAGGYVLRYRIVDSTIFIVHIRHYRENNFKS